MRTRIRSPDGWLYEGGNYVEEYALPWIAMALWVFFCFFRTGEVRPGHIVLLGIAFAAVLMLRPNMVAVWVSLMPAVLICFLREKRWKDIIRCLLLFLLGLIVLLLPILLWLRYLNCFRQMLECYLHFNLTYSDDIGLTGTTVWGLTKTFVRLLLPGVVGMLIAVAVFHRDKVQWLNLWYFMVSLLMVEMSGRDYPHYLIAQLPALVAGLTGFFQWTGRILQTKRPKGPDRNLILVSCVVILLGAVGYHAITGRAEYPERTSVTWLKENTHENDDILVLGNDAGLYLSANRKTSNRYFYQTPPVNISTELCADFMRELKASPSDYVVMNRSSFPAEGWEKDVMDLLSEEGYTAEFGDEFCVFCRPGWPSSLLKQASE